MIKLGVKSAPTFKKLFITVSGLFIFQLALFIAGGHSNFIEVWYTHGLYSIISGITHTLSGWIPFSIGDILYIGVIIICIHTVWKLITHAISRRWGKLGLGLLKLIIGLQLFIVAFYLLWGLNYSRPAVSKILNLPDDPYTVSQLTATTNLLIDSVNARRALLNQVDWQTSNSRIFQSAKKATEILGKNQPAFRSYNPAAKRALFTPVLNYMGTAGYFNPFTGEAQVNYSMPLVNRPVTACHEMAHQMGFAREDEANFIGFIAGINSTDHLLRYSAYYMAMEEFLHQARLRDTVLFHHLKSRISIPVKQDMKADRAYWLRYQNQIGYVTSLFYDQFLKANKQPDGLQSYNRMINLTMAYYKQDNKLKIQHEFKR